MSEMTRGERGQATFSSPYADSRTWRYRMFELLRSKILEPGRYAIVFTKPAEDPGEFFHAKFPAAKAAKLPEEYLAIREHPARGDGGFQWTKDPGRVIYFGVYGHECPTK